MSTSDGFDGSTIGVREVGGAATARPVTRRSLEERANFLRARLTQGLDTLRQRKAEFMAPAEELKRHPTVALVALGGAALLVTVSAAVVTFRASTRAEHVSRTHAWIALVTYRGRSAGPPRRVAVALLEKLITAALTAGLSLLAHRLVDRGLPPRVTVLPSHPT